MIIAKISGELNVHRAEPTSTVQVGRPGSGGPASALFSIAAPLAGGAVAAAPTAEAGVAVDGLAVLAIAAEGIETVAATPATVPRQTERLREDTLMEPPAAERALLLRPTSRSIVRWGGPALEGPTGQFPLSIGIAEEPEVGRQSP